MIKTIVGIVVALLAAFLIFAATKPDTFRVERAATIKAPPEKIFALISDLHGWGSWSPWEKMDPAMKTTYSGAASGKGAVYKWEGSGKPGGEEWADSPAGAPQTPPYQWWRRHDEYESAAVPATE
jgi:hypothetical protein